MWEVTKLKRLVFLSLSLLLVLIPGCITFKMPPPPATTPPVITLPAITPPAVTVPVPVSFSVTGITAGTEPSNAPGACPFMLYANITANGPGTVTYIWESMDGGGYSYTWSIYVSVSRHAKNNLAAGDERLAFRFVSGPRIDPQ